MALPDAPWIVEAETWGMPEPEPVYCPNCGAEDPEGFIFTRGPFPEIVGCTECMREGSREEAAELLPGGGSVYDD